LEGNQGEKNHEGYKHTPPQNPKEKGLEIAPKEITKKDKRERHIQAFRNYAESSIHTKEVHTRSMIGDDLDQHKDGPIFTAVSFVTR
jgi:hypothetical protein